MVGGTTACWVHLRLGLGPQSLTLGKSFHSPCNSCSHLPTQSVNSVASCRPTRRGRPTHCQLGSARLLAIGSQRLFSPVRARTETTHLTLSALGLAKLKEKKSIRIPPAVTLDRRRGGASGGEPRVAPPLEGSPGAGGAEVGGASGGERRAAPPLRQSRTLVASGHSRSAGAVACERR